MIETIYIARHGFRLNWMTNNWSSPTGTPRDSPLAAFGLEQAGQLADHFLSLPEADRPTVIVSSPYYRCLQTAKPVSEALNVPIFVDHGISEWYSPVKPGTGLHPRPSLPSTLKTFFLEIDDKWSPLYFPTRKGETVNEVHDRAGNFLEILHQKLEAPSSEQFRKVLLVSHAATVIALVRELLGERERPVRIGCCTLSVLNRRDNPSSVRGSYTDVAVGSAAHLQRKDDLRDWGFEDIALDTSGEVIEDIGEPGIELDEDFPVGPQLANIGPIEQPAKM